MFAAGYQMQGNNVATDFLEKILSRKCKIHQKLPCEYIHLRPSEFSPRLCCKCMEVRKIPLNDAISIRLLLEATSDTTFNAYPKFSDNSITEKIQDLKDNNSNDRIETDLQSFFKNLNSTVSQAIEKVKYEQKQKLSSLSNSYQDVLNSLAKISQVVQFQDLVKNKNENEDQLRAFIQQQDSQVNNYTGIMKNKLLEYQKIEQTFSLSDANNRFKQIILLIEGITLFPSIESNQQQQQQPLFQQQNHTQQPVHEQCIQMQQQPQQQEQLQQQQQLKQQEQKIQQLRKKEQQQNASSQRSDYDYYDSLREQVKNKWRLLLERERLLLRLESLLERRSYNKQQWEALNQQDRQDVISRLKKYLD